MIKLFIGVTENYNNKKTNKKNYLKKIIEFFYKYVKERKKILKKWKLKPNIQKRLKLIYQIGQNLWHIIFQKNLSSLLFFFFCISKFHSSKFKFQELDQLCFFRTDKTIFVITCRLFKKIILIHRSSGIDKRVISHLYLVNFAFLNIFSVKLLIIFRCKEL